MTSSDYRAQHYAAPTAAPRPARTPIWARIVLALLGVALLAACMGVVALALGDGGDDTSGGAYTATATGSAAAPAGKPRPRLQSGDVKITLKTTDKECFGSAGCNMVVTPKLSWPVDKDPGTAYDVTYVISYDTLDFDGAGARISGDETIGTAFILGGDQYETDSHILQTAKRDTKVTVKVDQVEARP